MNITIPDISPGELYAGIVLNKDGAPRHRLILLPQITDVRLNWDDAMAWAEVVRGTLPTRQESALLYANLKLAFEPTWYWTGEQYAGYASTAWGQNFDGGNQGLIGKGYKGRVRAVRRVSIEVTK